MGTDVLLTGLRFGEGPRWRDGRLWFSDFYRHGVYTVDEAGVEELVVEVPGQPSGLGWLPDGSMLIVSMTDRKLLRWDGDALEEYADLSGIATFHANDMLVDEQGRAYVGNFGFDLHQAMLEREVPEILADDSAGNTSLIRVDPDRSVHVAADDVRFPNGMVLLDGGRTLVVAETLRLQLTAFDVAADGTLSNRRVWASTAAQGVAADGICTDGETIWVAAALAPMVVGYRDGGEVAGTIETQQIAFACALGGNDGRKMFIMTAPSSHPAEVAEVEAGTIEVSNLV
jgi:sugar lactone lactonase YvrE